MNISSLPDGFTVHTASLEECKEIASEPKLISSLELEDGEVELSPDTTYMILKFREYKLLFSYKEHREKIYESHIACPRNSIIASRALVLAGLNWLFQDNNVKAKAVITSCTKGKTANMCKKLGFTELLDVSGKLYFMYTN